MESTAHQNAGARPNGKRTGGDIERKSPIRPAITAIECSVSRNKWRTVITDSVKPHPHSLRAVKASLKEILSVWHDYGVTHDVIGIGFAVHKERGSQSTLRMPMTHNRTAERRRNNTRHIPLPFRGNIRLRRFG